MLKNIVIDVEDMSFSYGQDWVLRSIRLSVDEGEFVTVVGDNGSGKTTLMKLLIGALKPNTGSVSIFSEPPRSEKAMRQMAYMPQNLAIRSIGFPMTCREVVGLALQRDFTFWKIPRKRHRKLAEEKLEAMGLGAYVDTPMKELSGGLQQRVMLTRALMTDPKLLILDEPTVGVDSDSKAQFLELLKELNLNDQVTIVLVTHEQTILMDALENPVIYRVEEGGLIRA